LAFDGVKNEGKIEDRIHQYASGIEPIPQYQIHTTDEKNGKVFVLIKIFEGDRTPYYVQNDANLWVRTGNISNPIDIASPDHTEILFNKKRDAEKQRENYIKRAYEIFDASIKEAEKERNMLIMQEKVAFEKEKKKAYELNLSFNREFISQYVQSSIGENIATITFLAQPFYPKRALSSPIDIQKSLGQIRFQNRTFEITKEMHPIQDGLRNFQWGRRDGHIRCEQLYSNGLYFLSADVLEVGEKIRYVDLFYIAAYLFIFLKTLKNFYNVINYEGGIVGFIQLSNARRAVIKLIEPNGFFCSGDDKEVLLDFYKWNLNLDTRIINDDNTLQNDFFERIKEIYWSLGYQPATDELYKAFLKKNSWLFE